MIKFEPEFVLIQYPGYAWHKVEQRLYTFKLGELRPLKFLKGFRGYANGQYLDIPSGYYVSHRGRRRYLSEMWLKDKYNSLNEDQTVPRKESNENEV